MVDLRDDEEEEVHDQHDPVGREDLADHRVLPDLEPVALVERDGRNGYWADEVEEGDVEDPLDEGDAREDEHHQHHEAAEDPDEVVHPLDVEEALHEVDVPVVELPGDELGYRRLLVRPGERVAADRGEELPAYRLVPGRPVGVHRDVDRAHDGVGQDYPGQHGERDQHGDEEALAALLEDAHPVLFLLVVRLDDGDAGEEDEQDHPNDEDEEERPLDGVGADDAGEQVALLPVDLHGVDAAEHVEDVLDEVDELADRREAHVQEGEEHVLQRVDEVF